MNVLPYFGSLACSYLVGSIPTAFIVVKWLKRVDVRSVGSGNVGATNVIRAAGFRAGIVVFILDMAKGIVATLFLASLFDATPDPTLRLGCGFAAVIGHMFPVYLQFNGGKGVATTIGVLATTMPIISGIALCVGLVCFAIWRYVSVSSMAAVVIIPFAQLVAHKPVMDVVIGAILAILIVIRHQGNIQRLVQGKEHRIGNKSN